MISLRFWSILFALTPLFFLGGCGNWFRSTYPEIDRGEMPELKVPRAEVPPDLDASTEDLIWSEATVIEQLAKVESKYTRDLEIMPTRILLLWSEDGLYLRFECADDVLVTPAVGHDGKHHDGDIVEVIVDPEGDQTRWMEVQVSPLNQILDIEYHLTGAASYYREGVLSDESIRDVLESDLSWTMEGFQSSTWIGPEQTWIVEMKIPAEVLADLAEFDGKLKAGMKLNANFIRYERWARPVPGEKARWNMLPMQWVGTVFGRPNTSPFSMGTLELVEAR
ncbi:MAG: carbohydrate-binding family 9-like protein [Puniceicoccales bacterium]